MTTQSSHTYSHTHLQSHTHTHTHTHSHTHTVETKAIKISSLLNFNSTVSKSGGWVMHICQFIFNIIIIIVFIIEFANTVPVAQCVIWPGNSIWTNWGTIYKYSTQLLEWHDGSKSKWPDNERPENLIKALADNMVTEPPICKLLLCRVAPKTFIFHKRLQYWERCIHYANTDSACFMWRGQPEAWPCK